VGTCCGVFGMWRRIFGRKAGLATYAYAYERISFISVNLN
jgi:hypothetical protein